MLSEYVNTAVKCRPSLKCSSDATYPDPLPTWKSNFPPLSLRGVCISPLAESLGSVTSFFKEHGPFSQTRRELLMGRDQGLLISVSPTEHGTEKVLNKYRWKQWVPREGREAPIVCWLFQVLGRQMLQQIKDGCQFFDIPPWRGQV